MRRTRCMSRARFHAHDLRQPASGFLSASAAFLSPNLSARHLFRDARSPCEARHNGRLRARNLAPQLDGPPEPRGHLSRLHAMAAKLRHASTPGSLAQVVFATGAVARHAQEAVQHRARHVLCDPDGGAAQAMWARFEEARQVHGLSPGAGWTPLRRRQRGEFRIGVGGAANARQRGRRRHHALRYGAARQTTAFVAWTSARRDTAR
jgi:hypothetical protein